MTRRSLAFAVIVAACIAGATAYVLRAAGRHSDEARAPVAPALAGAGASLPEPFLVFRRTSLGSDSGALAAAPLADLASFRLSRLRCERVHMAGGSGICLAADRGVFTTYRAVLFDRSFGETGALPLAGAPSRAQVSPDGRLAATTVFVSGHSYALGGFSTRTSIVDMRSRTWLVEDLESFEVRRDGETIRSPDFNLWGVTFAADGRQFYATLGTGSEVLLTKGDLQARTLEVVEKDVECPSLSPDGRRVAFKGRSSQGPGPISWRIWVLDLGSHERHPLAETRSVDDQVQWIDHDRVLYALPGDGDRARVMDEWVVPADGTGEPQLFLREAYSAGVARN